ncbi:hypothetical protein EYC80_004431 [Monilinia laxa]|uniref:Uncharacterized protein n=1 Tax=Monilinia laxa TaxID=61186 RepID=A0A5N6KNC7_MONLA|nr:hypothetical protein EYC80_004431 [Monilinia laxa]
MNNLIQKKARDVAKDPGAMGDQKSSKLITIQSSFSRNGKDKISYMTASEETVFEKLPLIRSLFELNRKGTFKKNNTQILYDSKYANTEKPAVKAGPGRTLYVQDLIESKFTQYREGYNEISKWNLKTLWTLMNCLVRFIDGKPLHPDSRIGRSEKFWQKELKCIEVLATYFGNTELKDKAVRGALISYMRQVPAIMPTYSRSRLDKEEETMKRPNIPEMQNVKNSYIDGLTEAPKKPKRKSYSNPITQKLKKPKLTPPETKKATQSTPTLQNSPNIPSHAYIQLNQSYPGFLHVNIKTALKGSSLIGLLLQDLYSGTFATEELSKFVGKDRDGKPTLLWDEVLKYFSKPGSTVECMLSWSEDERWVPLVMFIERCQVKQGLWEDWDESDLELARCFDAFVKASFCASEVRNRK